MLRDFCRRSHSGEKKNWGELLLFINKVSLRYCLHDRFTIDVFYFKQTIRLIQGLDSEQMDVQREKETLPGGWDTLAVILECSRDRHQGVVPALLHSATLSYFSSFGMEAVEVPVGQRILESVSYQIP